MGLHPVGIACFGISVSPSAAPLERIMTIKTALQRQKFPHPCIKCLTIHFQATVQNIHNSSVTHHSQNILL
ncbi:hypothetical protein HOLleu_08788 [Holothuria leucospilota]|uniref:Uncharacterized protein n=1 Tax=Holothuria leucospilota TaxID=206669 RepID=A0A9Q1CJ99_HOLLE|nr:hypothetical protein HOLleu_08788 [Holothuria leucospilota]